MTRKHMYDAIKARIEEEGLGITSDESKAVVDAAIVATLDYVLFYAYNVAHELASKRLYSEAMVAGLFIKTIKSLMK